MNTTDSFYQSQWKLALKYGGIAAAMIGVILLVFHFSGRDVLSPILSYANLIFVNFAILLFLNEYKRTWTPGNIPSYWTIFKKALKPLVVFSLCYGLIYLLYATFINPEYINFIKENVIEQYKKGGIEETMIIAYEMIFDQYGLIIVSLGYFSSMFIFGLIPALLVCLIIKFSAVIPNE